MIHSEKSHYYIHPFHSNHRGNLRICVPPKCVLCFQNELGFPHSSVGKESACNAGDLALIPGLGRSPGEGNGNLLHYSCLENPMDRGAWQATVQGVARVGHNLATTKMCMVKQESLMWLYLETGLLQRKRRLNEIIWVSLWSEKTGVLKRRDTRVLSPSLCTCTGKGPSEDTARRPSASQKRMPDQKPNFSGTLSWASNLRTLRKFLLFKPLRLWYVMAALAGLYRR